VVGFAEHAVERDETIVGVDVERGAEPNVSGEGLARRAPESHAD